jgi:hypothetical protein
MIKKFSKLTTPVNPFLLRILKTGEARTLLLGIGTSATLLLSGCANGGLGAKTRASFISPSERHDFGTAEAAESSGFVDFSKDPYNQTGPTYPRYGGIGEP